VLFGVLGGVLCAVLVRLAASRSLAEGSWLQALPVGSAALAYGLAAPLGGSGFIAAFAAGLTYGALRRGRTAETTRLLEELGGLANAATFIVFGAAVVGPSLAQLTWKAVLYGVISLTAIRMVPVALALVGTHARARTVAFVGWFGPRGLASIVFTVIVLEESSLPHVPAIAVVVVFTIVLSVYAHGLSAQLLTSRYASWYESHPEDRRPEMESVQAPQQRWRHAPAVVGRGP
jgi:NhaP-type Na+/H+ or K+/H+ antiporter